jgi:methyltransferase family protein
MSDTRLEHIGGWMPEIAISSADARILRREDLRTLALDAYRLRYFRTYRAKYFFDRFVAGQGTEAILDLLTRVPAPQKWLDIGAGTTTLFWAIPLTGVHAIDCCDLSPEALSVLSDFVASDEVPPCYRQVLAMFGKDSSHLADMRRRFRNFIVMNAMSVWPPALSGGGYDLISAIGLFGLAASPHGYRDAIRNVVSQVATGGYLMGADWVRSTFFVEQEGHDNSYVDSALVAEAGHEAGLTLVTSTDCAIEGDPLYSRLVVWLLRRQP